MAGSVNKVILVGNLGADPEIRRHSGWPADRQSAGGDVLKAGGIAIPARGASEPNGHRVVIFSEGLCKIAEQYLRKGSKIYLEGQLQTRKWQDQSGQGPVFH